MNVGVLIIGMGSLSGAGGAERFYADLFEAYNSQANPKRKLFYISDDLSPLHKINKLKSFPENQLTFTSYHYRLLHRITKNHPRIDKWMNNFRAYLTTKSLIKQLKKQNVFDDFIAAAEYLVRERYTRPQKLGIHGRSNGGLLVGAALTQRPELFGAALPAVGVLDMLRYHTASANARQ